jgi:hypothetical protein
MLDRQDLEHNGCDQGDVHERLDSRHRIGDQMFAFLGPALEVLDGQRLAFELQAGRGPEVVSETAHNMLDCHERHLDLETEVDYELKPVSA